MKVAVVTQFPADPLRPRGGVEAVSVNLACALRALDDVELHVVTMDQNCAAPERADWHGITVHRLPRRERRMLTNAVGAGRRSVSRFLLGLAPDIVHAHDVFGLMVKGLPIPRVFTIHGFIYGDTLVSEHRWSRLRSWVWRRIETSGWADQPHIISISPYVRERLAGIATGVIHDIDNPIGESFFDLKRNEIKGTVFSAALICRRKNQIRLVEAVAVLQNRGVHVELRLAGVADGADYERRLRNCIQVHRLEQEVKILGGISSDQVRRELTSASVFALVSLEENSPMGIEEAMAAGVPVVTSNRCGMPYMVRNGESGFLVNPNDPDDIADRLQLLLEDDALRQSMGAKGRQIAQDRFHPSIVACRTHQVYVRAIRDHARRSGRA